MSEDRTQAASPRRRQLAREHGQVARSPELTAAAALLAASVLLGMYGGRLVEALVGLAREPWVSPLMDAGPEAITARLRASAWAVAGPLGMIAGGAVVAAVAAHQAQVRGLWAPSLLAPDAARLWGGFGGGFLSRSARGAWALAKAAALVAVASWAIRAGLAEFGRAGGLEPHDLARASGSSLKDAVILLSLAMAGLGLLDFAMQWGRLEAQLRLTPDEYREEMRSLDGDPALRSRRRRAARDRAARPASLQSASLILTGDSGLIVALSGGPPPGRVTVLASARGLAGSALIREAAECGLPIISSPDLASHFSRGRAAGPSLPPELSARLIEVWPA